MFGSIYRYFGNTVLQQTSRNNILYYIVLYYIDQITNLRILTHKAREHQQSLYMCFVDFKKAFVSISHDKLWVTMMGMGYPIHLIDLLAKLYKKQLAKVKVAGTLSE